MDLLKMITETLERGSLLMQQRLLQIVQKKSHEMSRLVIVIKIRLTWPESYLVGTKKKLQRKYQNQRKILDLSG